MKVNGLDMPQCILDGITAGWWKMPSDEQIIRNVFPLECAPVRPVLYAEAAIERENSNWPADADPYFIGDIKPDVSPGKIQPDLSVLIGDLGPDRPIALDYRTSQVNPSVVYLASDPVAVWVTAAPSIDKFIEMLGLKSQHVGVGRQSDVQSKSE